MIVFDCTFTGFRELRYMLSSCIQICTKICIKTEKAPPCSVPFSYLYMS